MPSELSSLSTVAYVNETKAKVSCASYKETASIFDELGII